MQSWFWPCDRRWDIICKSYNRYARCCFDCLFIRRHCIYHVNKRICVPACAGWNIGHCWNNGPIASYTLKLNNNNALQWRHNGRDSVSNHQLSRLFSQPFFQTQVKENIKAPCHWLLCGEFIWWRHHGFVVNRYYNFNMHWASRYCSITGMSRWILMYNM